MSKEIQAKEIIKKTCKYYGIEEKMMYKRIRKVDIITARHMAIYLIKRDLKMTHTDIADLFKKERTTIIHAVHKMQDLLSLPHEIEIKKDVENISFLTQIH